MRTHIKIRLAAVAASLAVPLVGMGFGSPGGFFVVLLAGGPFLLAYLLTIRTPVGSVVGGIALLGITIASEMYVIARWPESSTAALGYLYIPFVSIPVLVVAIAVEALARPQREDRRDGGGRALSPAGWSLLLAMILAVLWIVLMCPWIGGWCWPAIAVLLSTFGAIGARLLLEKRRSAG